ncbi:sel1 repeat family protein [Sphingobacterium sp. DN00404]|uniref:Sel1 repeat family protein n=1 Tax=Sphingobacterium micropteri TaxID=2763501 RepID=A0ABR7YRE0_9SPHI|nr:tetratricopeptide repeat protein [Sphingobacterium micropteri]MBD1433913.1 sel1 repeat family protein [Sphingobacterium micropteri]
MTKEQAYEKLELPIGTDLQVVRQKFNQMHNEFLMQIDGVSFNPAMKQKKEQQLEELKEAYTLLNQSEGMDDSASLPRTERTFEQGSDRATESASAAQPAPSLKEALALFGLTALQDTEEIQQTIQQRLDQLTQQYQTIDIPVAKEAYKKEIDKANEAKQVIDKWIAERQASEKQAEQAQQRQAPPTTPPLPAKKSKAWVYVLPVLLVVGAMAYFVSQQSGKTTPEPQPQTDITAAKDSTAWKTAIAVHMQNAYQHYLSEFPEGIFAQAAKDSIAQLQGTIANDTQIATAPPTQDNKTTQQLAAQQERIKQLEQEAARKKEAESKPTTTDINSLVKQAKTLFDNKNYTEAAKLHRPAADQGNAEAQNQLGYMYLHGKGVTKSDVEAVKLFQKAAEQGNSDAYTNLGYCYANGRGVGRDNAEAVKWYRKAVNLGDATAINNLGYMYKHGLGVPKDVAEALKLYLQAANQGDKFGQYNLGFSYEKGDIVEKDIDEAIKWYKKAAKQGDQDAINKLKNLGITEY